MYLDVYLVQNSNVFTGHNSLETGKSEDIRVECVLFTPFFFIVSYPLGTIGDIWFLRSISGKNPSHYHYV